MSPVPFGAGLFLEKITKDNPNKMKRTVLITLVSILTVVQASAQLANGYYRIQNNASSRYITLRDNQVGEIDYSSTNPDLSNIQTWRGFDYVKSNPGSIIYVEQVGSQYNLKVQGTSIYKITGGKTYLDLKSRNGAYIISASYSSGGIAGSASLYDSTEDDDEGYVKRTGEAAYQYWLFIPVDTDNNYIGLQPTVQVGDSYYGTLYASYPFKAASSGIKFYYVDAIAEGKCQLQEITSEIIPAATPLVFMCSSNDPANNKVTPVTDETTAPASNMLGGTYFARTSGHKVNVRYDESSMRVLGKNDAGELAFIKATKQDLTSSHYIPANTCWLNIPEEYTGEFKALSSGEYTGIRNINADTKNKADNTIYTLTGTKANAKTLRPGIYIQSGKKIVIK